jgi:hypothetical protein
MATPMLAMRSHPGVDLVQAHATDRAEGATGITGDAVDGTTMAIRTLPSISPDARETGRRDGIVNLVAIVGAAP